MKKELISFIANGIAVKFGEAVRKMKFQPEDEQDYDAIADAYIGWALNNDDWNAELLGDEEGSFDHASDALGFDAEESLREGLRLAQDSGEYGEPDRRVSWSATMERGSHQKRAKEGHEQAISDAQAQRATEPGYGQSAAPDPSEFSDLAMAKEAVEFTDEEYSDALTAYKQMDPASKDPKEQEAYEAAGDRLVKADAERKQAAEELAHVEKTGSAEGLEGSRRPGDDQPSGKSSRCETGTRKNRKTGQCEPFSGNRNLVSFIANGIAAKFGEAVRTMKFQTGDWDQETGKALKGQEEQSQAEALQALIDFAQEQLYANETALKGGNAEDHAEFESLEAAVYAADARDGDVGNPMSEAISQYLANPFDEELQDLTQDAIIDQAAEDIETGSEAAEQEAYERKGGGGGEPTASEWMEKRIGKYISDNGLDDANGDDVMESLGMDVHDIIDEYADAGYVEGHEDSSTLTGDAYADVVDRLHDEVAEAADVVAGSGDDYEGRDTIGIDAEAEAAGTPGIEPGVLAEEEEKPSGKRTRCEKGTRKNRKTGQCEPHSAGETMNLTGDLASFIANGIALKFAESVRIKFRDPEIAKAQLEQVENILASGTHDDPERIAHLEKKRAEIQSELGMPVEGDFLDPETGKAGSRSETGDIMIQAALVEAMGDAVKIQDRTSTANLSKWGGNLMDAIDAADAAGYGGELMEIAEALYDNPFDQENKDRAKGAIDEAGRGGGGAEGAEEKPSKSSRCEPGTHKDPKSGQCKPI